jgi:hypothetical protein
VIFARRRAAPGPGSVPERWRQVFEAGQVELHPFSQGELDAVTLEPESAHPEGGLPYLQRLSPLLVQAVTLAAMASDPLPNGNWDLQPGPRLDLQPGPGADATLQTAGMGELAGAVPGLEAAGFVRPAPPAPPEGQMPVEFAGLAAAGDGRPPRRVALAGDLGLITYMMCRPLFVAEIYRAADPARPDPAPSGWQLVARGYTPYEMPGCLIERPPTRTAQPAPPEAQPPLVILREDRAAAALLAWLGGDVSAYLKLRAARAAAQPGGATLPGEPARTDLPGQVAPTVTVAAGFSQLARLSLIMPEGQEVVLRALAVGTGAGGHWLLTGEHLELATAVTLGQLGDRLDDMLATASRPGAAGLPA